MNLGVAHGWVLLLLPLSLVPLVFRGLAPVAYSSLLLIPRDGLSEFLGIALRGIGAVAIALVILGLSGLFRPPQEIERIGEGAHIVLLLDRSRSMDQPFGGQRYAVHALTSPLRARGFDSKGKVARGLLWEFAASRRNDMFGMLVFSTYPIQVLPLTDSQEMVHAAITAGNIGRGLAQTDVGAGLVRALEFFDDQPYTGSRIIMLISDGGARLDLATRTRISNLMRRHRAALYWIYIRSRNSPGISEAIAGSVSAQTAPARALHEFFSDMGTPYRAYDAENPRDLERAIADVNRLQNLPIRYTDLVPRRDLSGLCYRLALVFVLLLIGAKLLEVKVWR